MDKDVEHDLEIPPAAAAFIAVAGIDWPRINVGDIHELAAAIRDFAGSVQGTNDEMGVVVHQVVALFGGGQAGQQVLESWERWCVEHMEELIFRCQVAAQAVDACATFYLEHAGAAIARLTTTAVEHAAADEPERAAELAAVGHQEAADLTEAVLAFMRTYLIGKAIEPLEETVADLVNGAGWHSGWHTMTASGDAQSSIRANNAEILRMADVMDGLADAILRHAAEFSRRAGALDFQ
ncbi:hypothetical protein ABH926_004269 [Catenulispora sp. GP43]|uniref:hypothetical protein n=1 Tax=Catenulispora sp. GP43 TaxID=3156263 RepID=UPI003516FDC3